MIEAQALYINALIKKVRIARQKGGSIRIAPKSEVVQKYNKEIQSRNWSDAVIPYQKRTSSIDWNEYEISGTDADEIKKEGHTKWARVVEETQVSNGVILAGLVTAVAAVAARAFYRGASKSVLA